MPILLEFRNSTAYIDGRYTETFAAVWLETWGTDAIGGSRFTSSTTSGCRKKFQRHDDGHGTETLHCLTIPAGRQSSFQMLLEAPAAWFSMAPAKRGCGIQQYRPAPSNPLCDSALSGESMIVKLLSRLPRRSKLGLAAARVVDEPAVKMHGTAL